MLEAINMIGKYATAIGISLIGVTFAMVMIVAFIYTCISILKPLKDYISDHTKDMIKRE